MEIIDVFFYKLSRKIITFWDLIVGYYNGSTEDEKILLFALLFVIVLFLYVVFVLALRINFNRRIKKFDFVNVAHINQVNEVYKKNIFARFFLFFWNFKKLVIFEIKPSSISIDPKYTENEDLVDTVEEKFTEEETLIEEPAEELLETNETLETKVVLSKEVEEFIEKRILELSKTLTDSSNIIEKENEPLIVVAPEVTKPQPTYFEEDVTETVDELTEDLEVSSEQEPVVDEVIIENIESPSVEEKPTEEPKIELSTPKPPVDSVVEEEDDFFFNKESVKKYIVSKHSISGWQIKKEGSKRASRLFNSKKQAVAYATKSKFDFEVR